jgi:hypothetical protein
LKPVPTGAWLGLLGLTALAAVLDVILLVGWVANRGPGVDFDWRWPIASSLVLVASAVLVIVLRKPPLAELRGSDRVDE